MEPLYQHTQTGHLMLGALGAASLLLVVLLVNDFHWIGLAVLALLAGCLVLFGSLTVTLDAANLSFRFGPGPIRKSFAVREIVAARPVTNPFWYGWGIRLTPHGWLYNVSGRHAVEVQMRDGRRYRIGTDEPQALTLAIESAIQAAPGRLETEP